MSNQKLTSDEIWSMFGNSMPMTAAYYLMSDDVSSGLTPIDEVRATLTQMAKAHREQEVKQMIVMRNDLGMRKGKIAAQAGHATMGALFNNFPLDAYQWHRENPGCSHLLAGQDRFENLIKWFDSGTAKICARVDSEAELMEIFDKAIMSGLPAYCVTDAGRTEFKEPTITCCAIGPAPAGVIDTITGHLKLL